MGGKGIDTPLPEGEGYDEYNVLQDAVADRLLEILFNYGPERYFFAVSHLADADGLSGETGATIGMRSLADMVGNNGVKVDSERVMGIETDPGAKASLESIHARLSEGGEGHFLFSDLGSLDPMDLPGLYPEGTVVLDHHQPRPSPSGVFYLNPNAHGIDGGKELSAGAATAFLFNAVGDRLLKMYAGDPSTEKQRKRLEERLTYSTVIGIAGSAADQQSVAGANAALYHYLERKHMISWVDSPLYGYFLKPLQKAVAESDIPFNLKYRPPTFPEAAKALGGVYEKNISGWLDKHYRQLKFLLAVGPGNKAGTNQQYLDYLTGDEVGKLNAVSQDALDRTLIMDSRDGRYLTDPDGGVMPVVFDDYTDDYHRGSDRTAKANIFLRSIGIDPDSRMSELTDDQRGRLLAKYVNSVVAFSEPVFRESYLSQLHKGQYVIAWEGSRVFSGLSIAEIANLMTSTSKLGHGPLFNAAVALDLDLPLTRTEIAALEKEGFGKWQDREDIFSRLKEIHLEYRHTISQGMGMVEEMIFDKGMMRHITKTMHYLPLDTLADELKVPSILPFTGVFGGIVANVGMLPGRHGILFTGAPAYGHQRKISGRANLAYGESIHLGEFFSDMKEAGIVESGGGHPTASSCYLEEDMVPEFFDAVKEYEFDRELVHR